MKRSILLFVWCAGVLAAACTGDDSVDPGAPIDAATTTPPGSPLPPPLPDATPASDASTEAATDAGTSSDGSTSDSSTSDGSTSDGSTSDGSTSDSSTSDGSAEAGPPTGLGPDGIVRGTVPPIRFSFVARLPSASALCPAYATVVGACCVWSATIQSPGRLAFTYGLSAAAPDLGKITIDGFDFHTLLPRSWDWSMGPPPGNWPTAQLNASSAGFGPGRDAWPRFLELMHHLATRYGTAADAQSVRDFTDKGMLTSVLFSLDRTAHSIGWYPRGPSLVHDWYVSGSPGVRVNQSITSPACQSTFDPIIDQYRQSVSF